MAKTMYLENPEHLIIWNGGIGIFAMIEVSIVFKRKNRVLVDS
jgi:hypothetical protein